jgi:transposase
VARKLAMLCWHSLSKDAELPADERAAIDRHLRELDRLGEDLAVLDREISERMIEDPSVKRS